MDLQRPEDNFAAFTEVVGADGVDDQVIERKNAYKGKERVYDVGDYIDHLVAKASVHMAFFSCRMCGQSNSPPPYQIKFSPRISLDRPFAPASSPMLTMLLSILIAVDSG